MAREYQGRFAGLQCGQPRLRRRLEGREFVAGQLHGQGGEAVGELRGCAGADNGDHGKRARPEIPPPKISR